MDVQIEPVEPRQLQLTIVVPEERIDKAMGEVAQDFARRLHIAGYRPGKVPLRVVLARVEEETLRKEALERLKEQAVREAVRQEKLEPWAGIDVEVVQDEPFTLRAVVPLAPQVELADRSVLDARPEPVPPVTDEDVDAILETWRQERATMETVERPAAAGDTLVMTLAGTGDGLDPIERIGAQLALTGDGATRIDLPPAIVEHLVGASAGERREFALTYPEFWPAAQLQGREIRFVAEIEAVMARTLPAIDDAFARDTAHTDSLQELRGKLRESLEAEARRVVEGQQVEALIDALVTASKVEYPPVALAQETAMAIVDLRRQVERQGLAWERWLELQKRTEEELWAEIEPEAAKQLRRRLVLRRFVEVEGIRVSDREIDSEIDRLRRPLDRTTRRALPPVGALRRSAGSRLLSNRAVQRLVEIAAENTQDEGVAADQSEPDQPVD